MVNNLQRAKLGEEMQRNASTFDGSTQLLGTFSERPVMVIIQNDTTVSVVLKDDPTMTAGITFVAGTKMILDMRANNGMAAFFTFDDGSSLYASGAAGTGLFKVAYIYAR